MKPLEPNKAHQIAKKWYAYVVSSRGMGAGDWQKEARRLWGLVGRATSKS